MCTMQNVLECRGQMRKLYVSEHFIRRFRHSQLGLRLTKPTQCRQGSPATRSVTNRMAATHILIDSDSRDTNCQIQIVSCNFVALHFPRGMFLNDREDPLDCGRARLPF